MSNQQEQTFGDYPAASAVRKQAEHEDLEASRKRRQEQDRRAINREIWEGGPIYPEPPGPRRR